MSGPAEATRRASSTAWASSIASPMASRTSARGAPRPLLNRQATMTEAAPTRAAASPANSRPPASRATASAASPTRRGWAGRRRRRRPSLWLRSCPSRAPRQPTWGLPHGAWWSPRRRGGRARAPAAAPGRAPGGDPTPPTTASGSTVREEQLLHGEALGPSPPRRARCGALASRARQTRRTRPAGTSRRPRARGQRRATPGAGFPLRQPRQRPRGNPPS